MICETCGRKYTYSFVINDEYWYKVTNGVREGRLCAHCVLEVLGGVDWYLVDCEPLRKGRNH